MSRFKKQNNFRTGHCRPHYRVISTPPPPPKKNQPLGISYKNNSYLVESIIEALVEIVQVAEDYPPAHLHGNLDAVYVDTNLSVLLHNIIFTSFRQASSRI